MTEPNVSPMAFSALVAAIVSYDKEPITLSLSHGKGTPRSLDRVITPITIATAGAMVKTVAVIEIFLSLALSIPISRPRFQALIKKKKLCASTTVIMSPLKTNRIGLFTPNSKMIPPCFFLPLYHSI